MKANIKTIKCKAKENTLQMKNTHILETLKMIISRVEGNAFGLTIRSIQVSGWLIKCMGRGSSLGKTGSYIQGRFFIYIIRSFKDDKFDGFGQFTWPNGVVYKGYWDKGEMHGTGQLTTEKGETFSGTWSNG